MFTTYEDINRLHTYVRVKTRNETVLLTLKGDCESSISLSILTHFVVELSTKTSFDIARHFD